MKDYLHTVVIPGGASIGPLSLAELRERLRREPVPEDSTVIIHTRLGDQLVPINRHPELRTDKLLPENSVVCPHCETTQPLSMPGEVKCVRCGTKLVISETYAITLGSDPKLLWYLSLPGLFGLLAFAKPYPSEIGFWTSLTTAFGVPLIMMLRQGVAYSKTGKYTAHEAPILYAIAVTVAGAFTLLGFVFLIFTLKQR